MTHPSPLTAPTTPRSLPLLRSLAASLALSLLLCVPALLLGLPAQSSAQTQGPATRYVRQRHDEVTRIMRRSADTEAARSARSVEVTRILSDLLDYQELSRRALADHWESRTPAQREEFVGLLRQLVERNYEANLARIQDFEVEYTREESVSDGTVVHTEARSRTSRRSPPVEIHYSMHREGSSWRVFDVNTDGVSLVSNYRRQFNRIIASDGWDALIRRMRERLASGGSD